MWVINCNKTLQALPSGDGGMRVGKEKIMGIPRLEKELLAETRQTMLCNGRTLRKIVASDKLRNKKKR